MCDRPFGPVHFTARSGRLINPLRSSSPTLIARPVYVVCALSRFTGIALVPQHIFLMEKLYEASIVQGQKLWLSIKMFLIYYLSG